MADTGSGGKARRRKNPHPKFHELLIVVRSGFDIGPKEPIVFGPEHPHVLAEMRTAVEFQRGWPTWTIVRAAGTVTYVFPTGEAVDPEAE